MRISSLSPDFPTRVRVLKRVPEEVETIGDLPSCLAAPVVAIVGTRDASVGAERFAYALGAQLASVGIVVASGGAHGVDIAAHRGAISTGRTLAVLPGSASKPSPRQNAAIFDEIVRLGGALLGVHPDTHSFHDYHYFQRNHVLAALSDHVVLVEAALRSGARSTTAAARRLARPVWCVPGPPWNKAMEGNLADLALGATELLSAEPLFQALGCSFSRETLLIGCEGDPVEHPQRIRKARRRSAPVQSVEATSTDTQAFLAGLSPPQSSKSARSPMASCPNSRLDRHPALLRLGKGIASMDDLVGETGLSVAELAPLLLTWRVEGIVKEALDGRFLLAVF